MRTVGPDDLQGVCDAYPKTSSPMACYGYIQSNGCAYGIARAPTAIGWSFVCLLLLLGAATWRARRTRPHA
jgi:hypothetical protein